MGDFKYTIAQLNFIVGDIEGNYNKIRSAYLKALESKSDLLITSELALVGYTPEDLVLKKSFINKAYRYKELLIHLTKNQSCAIILGSILERSEKLYNAAFLIADGKILHTVTKHQLPNYGVFDEKRLFLQGKKSSPFEYRGIKLGLMICEDAWLPDVPCYLVDKGADVFITLNASPFSKEKFSERYDITRSICMKYKKTCIYVNQVGGQDSLVFDGGSFVINSDGEIAVKAKLFHEDHVDSAFSLDNKCIPKKKAIDIYQISDSWKSVYQAVMLGLKDYVQKNNFDTVVLGLSGGVDSAFVASIAVDALGSDNVFAVMLRSEYTSEQSLNDAELLSQNLNINYRVISIDDAMSSICKSISNAKLKDITYQNLQSRIRGIMLMGISNDTGALLLSASNKSETAVGYSTLYGDSCGAYAPIKDIYKTELYAIAEWRNNNMPDYALGKKGMVIHNSVLIKSPSAELAHNQVDQDTLPPYEILDPILHHLIEDNLSKSEIINKGFKKDTVDQISRMLYASEFKRRQSPPGVKISKMYFNIDRRYPITNRFFG